MLSVTSSKSHSTHVWNWCLRRMSVCVVPIMHVLVLCPYIGQAGVCISTVHSYNLFFLSKSQHVHCLSSLLFLVTAMHITAQQQLQLLNYSSQQGLQTRYVPLEPLCLSEYLETFNNNKIAMAGQIQHSPEKTDQNSCASNVFVSCSTARCGTTSQVILRRKLWSNYCTYRINSTENIL